MSQRLALQRIHVACAIGLLVFAPVTSVALELGEAAIRSGLGQSLLVEIPYRLAGDERLASTCIGLVPAPRPDRALPTYSRVSRIAVTTTHIEIFGDGRVLEPLIGLTVDVHCDTAPHFVRSYQLFVDPPARIPAILSNGIQVAAARAGAAANNATPIADGRAAASAASRNGILTTTNGATADTAATRAPRATVSARARGQTGGTLAQGQTYVVVRGDTLSGIAARIGARPVTIREAAEAIFAANPDAFARGNRDLLEAGHSITIPLLTGATAALPAPAEAAPPPVAREAEPTTAAVVPPAELLPAPTRKEPEPAVEVTSPVPVPENVGLPAGALAGAQSSAAPVSLPSSVAPGGASPATTGRTSAWLTALLALGAVIVLSAPLLFVRRRQRPAALPGDAKARPAHPRQLIDPVAGFDVVEEPRTTAPSAAREVAPPSERAGVALIASHAGMAPKPDALALAIGPTDSVDLDVGVPVMVDEGVDWFGDRADAAAPANPVFADATIEAAATARIPELDSAATVRQQPIDAKATVPGEIDDEQHALTIVELDMLRQDYEAEHTLTQETNKELRDAVADLKATQAARAASADTATLEIPQRPQTEATASQQTRKLRSSR